MVSGLQWQEFKHAQKKKINKEEKKKLQAIKVRVRGGEINSNKLFIQLNSYGIQ